jgi:hypothetical protein
MDLGNICHLSFGKCICSCILYSVSHLDNSLDHGDAFLLLQDISEKLAGLDDQYRLKHVEGD